VRARLGDEHALGGTPEVTILGHGDKKRICRSSTGAPFSASRGWSAPVVDSSRMHVVGECGVRDQGPRLGVPDATPVLEGDAPHQEPDATIDWSSIVRHD
jgi:hypothetical protein